MRGSGENVSPSPCGRGSGGGVEATTLLDFARDMRRRPTRAERTLWYALRGRQIQGLKFRRQAPIGPFNADFFCPRACLIIEVDGSTHAGSTTDAGRDAWMRREGLRVLRFLDDEVISNLEGVLEAICAAARQPLPPTPSRKGRGSSLRTPDL